MNDDFYEDIPENPFIEEDEPQLDAGEPQDYWSALAALFAERAPDELEDGPIARGRLPVCDDPDAEAERMADLDLIPGD